MSKRVRVSYLVRVSQLVRKGLGKGVGTSRESELVSEKLRE